MAFCRLCADEPLSPLLDFGPQPLCNRFLSSPDEEEFRHPLALALCPRCGLVQLDRPCPPREVRSRFAWITYQEQEAHLDDLADRLRRLPGLEPGSPVCAITYKDDTLLERLARRGLKGVRRLDPERDLGIWDPKAGLETLQERLSPEKARELARRLGRADLVIARHVLEHSHDALSFLAALRELAAPAGHVALEVPDCSRPMEALDYGLPWEEHILYLTPATYRRLLAGAGIDLTMLKVYPYPMEDSLVALGRFAAGAGRLPKGDVAAELDRARSYAQGLPRARRRFAELLGEAPGKAALFGAGHRCAVFINSLELAGRLALVADDDPNKKGLFMPGSRLPIRGSAALLEEGIRLCLLNLSPQSEERVVARHKDFLERGGAFVSVFPESKLAPAWARR